MEFKTEGQLRKKFEEVFQKSPNPEFMKFIQEVENINQKRRNDVEDMREKGLTKLADEFEVKLNKEYEKLQLQIHKIKEDAFQKYLYEYNEAKKNFKTLFL